MPIPGTVRITGELAPSQTGDTYAVIDSKFFSDSTAWLKTITSGTTPNNDASDLTMYLVFVMDY